MRVLYLASAVSQAAIGVLFPLLADLQDRYDLPTWGLGAMTAAAFATSLLVQLGVAPLADKGHARRLLLGGLALGSVTLIGLAVSTELWQFILGRAFLGAAAGTFAPACQAVVAAAPADGTGAGERLGRLTAWNLGGFTISPVIGTLMARQFGLKTPFWAFAVVLAVAVALLWRVRVPRLHTSDSPRLALDLLRIPQVRSVVLLNMALYAPVGIYDSLWARYLTDRGASAVFVGVSLSLFTVPFILLATRGGRFADRIGPRRAAIGSLFVVVPSTVLYGSFDSPWLISGVGIFDAVGQAVAMPAVQSAMAAASPPGRAAAGQGLSGAMGIAAAGLASLLAAPAYQELGPFVLFAIAAATVAGLGALAAATGRPQPSTPPTVNAT